MSTGFSEQFADLKQDFDLKKQLIDSTFGQAIENAKDAIEAARQAIQAAQEARETPIPVEHLRSLTAMEFVEIKAEAELAEVLAEAELAESQQRLEQARLNYRQATVEATSEVRAKAAQLRNEINAFVQARQAEIRASIHPEFMAEVGLAMQKADNLGLALNDFIFNASPIRPDAMGRSLQTGGWNYQERFRR